MSDIITNNSKIARNTLFLYFRTIIIMFVSLYTSRVVLNTLGIEDFGVYNAVGGVVAMFAVISGSMSNAISRYITYGIGKGDDYQLKAIFSTSINIQLIISLVLVLLCELIGVWFLNNMMNIPTNRLVAANWVLQCSLLIFVINLISVPYNACIIAHEHMNAYAYISIFDAFIKLSVAYMLIISPIDKLIVYSVLLLLASLSVRLLYGFYCSRYFIECKYSFVYDRKLFREMLNFAGWNFFTNGASILNSQGVSILINIFFGVVANSARGIAIQVDSAVNQFVLSFSTAINPQITKSYAVNDKERMFYLVCKGAKFSYLLLLFFAVPILLEADMILKLWLVNVPDSAPLFVQLSIIGAMITVLGNTGFTACMATGHLRVYSIWITLVGSLVFFLTLLVYQLGAPIETTYFIYISVYCIVQIVRLRIMKHLMLFPIRLFWKNVISKIIFPTIVAIGIPLICKHFFFESILRLIVLSILSVVWTSICVYALALTSGERFAVSNKIKIYIHKLF